MPFGLSQAPSTFMWLMHHVLTKLIRKSVVVYFEDILVFSETLDDHVKHVREVLQLLRYEKLYAIHDKCTFGVDKLIFFGFVVSSNVIEVDESNTHTIKTWPQLTD